MNLTNKDVIYDILYLNANLFIL